MISFEAQIATNFKALLRIRMVEEAIVQHYSEQQMRCPIHLSIGQEAIAVGVCSQLSASDYLISNHRSHAHYLAKGGNLKKMIAEIYGKSTGCASGRGGSMHMIDLEANIVGTTPILGGSIPIGVGVAFASYLRDEDQITAIFFGEASTEEGVWAESLNIAALYSLPVLFVCENNFYSCYSPLHVRQAPERDRMAIANAHGIQTFSGDGNNLLEVSDITSKAVTWIRDHSAPCLIEFETYRYLEHCGPFKDPESFRPKEEMDHWLDRCPVKQMIDSLNISTKTLSELEAELNDEIIEAFQFAKESPFPIFNPKKTNCYA